MLMKTTYHKIRPYQTKDGSTIRELIHPKFQNNSHQSLAEAIVPVGAATFLHKHENSEEIYHIIAGSGRMILGEQTLSLQIGDSICIPPGRPHRVINTGKEPMKILCCCVPPYSHADTILLT